MDANRYIHPVAIGDVRLSNNLLLAPMAGYTNVAFRLIAKEVGGCGLVATEMVAAIGSADPGAQNADRFRILTQQRAPGKTDGDAGLWPGAGPVRRHRRRPGCRRGRSSSTSTAAAR